jgi:hypothetical protein
VVLLVLFEVDMSKIPGYIGSAYLFYWPMAPVTTVSTATFNSLALGFKGCENSFYFANTILGGRDAIAEFVAA